MIYAQFYHMSTGYVEGSIPPVFRDDHKKPIEVCGDRGVVIIDGRLSASNIKEIARRECVKRGFISWKLFKGENFSTAKELQC